MFSVLQQKVSYRKGKIGASMTVEPITYQERDCVRVTEKFGGRDEVK